MKSIISMLCINSDFIHLGLFFIFLAILASLKNSCEKPSKSETGNADTLLHSTHVLLNKATKNMKSHNSSHTKTKCEKT